MAVDCMSGHNSLSLPESTSCVVFFSLLGVEYISRPLNFVFDYVTCLDFYCLFILSMCNNFIIIFV